METPQQPTERCLQIRQAMEEHVRSRLCHALSKLEGKKEDSESKKKRRDALEKYQLNLILEKGVGVASGMAIASHITKATHPQLNVKEVTNFAIEFSELVQLEELGSHVLRSFSGSLLDATNNGAFNTAAYELYLLLDSHFEEKKLSTLLAQGDADVIAAFELGDHSNGFAVQCLGLMEDKCPKPATHGLSKQLYWLLNEGDPTNAADFEILVPLFPASLVHQAYLQIQERFNEANQLAREAKKDRQSHSGVFHEYKGMAKLGLGGAHPKNVSYLNQMRSGANYLQSSLPPVWKASAVRLPVHASSIFDKLFIARPEVCQTLRVLRQFLESGPPTNIATRERRESYTDALIDELVSCAGELQQLMQPGWSNDEERFKDLARAEQLWLDPLRAELPDQAEFAQEWLRMEWPEEIGKRFGRWLNLQLQNRLPVGDVEARFWAKELLTDEDGFKQQLRDLRRRLDVKAVAV